MACMEEAKRERISEKTLTSLRWKWQQWCCYQNQLNNNLLLLFLSENCIPVIWTVSEG